MSTPKPWEETWGSVTGAKLNRHEGATMLYVDDSAGQPEIGRVLSPERAALAKAAPDMARALLRHLDGCANTGSRTRGCDEIKAMHICRACDVKAALRKAGVLS